MSSKNKKDLTSIEEMGEYEHELDLQDQDSAEFSGLQEDEGESIEPFGGDGPPDVPLENNDFNLTEDFKSEDSFEVATNFGDDDHSAFSISSFEDEKTKTKTETQKPSDDLFEEDLSGEDMITDMVEETLDAKSPLPSADFLHTHEEKETENEKESKTETQLETYTPSPGYVEPEEFKDVKKFAESTWTGSSAEGNPSFSILLKNVRYIEDVNDIVTILREVNLLGDSEDQIKARLMRGHLLIPRISEFAAVFVAHKLRRFDIDIQVGLSDEIHPPKHHEAPEVGMVSKHNLYQNHGHHFHFDDPKLEISQIIVAATPSLEGYQVLRYMGVASEHKMIDGHLVEDDTSTEIPLHYQELAQKLKAHALKANSNAVVGLNYQLTPVPSEYGILNHKYRLSCTGNLVWVNKL